MRQCRAINKHKQTRCKAYTPLGKDVCFRHVDVQPSSFFDSNFLKIHSIQYGPSQAIFAAIKLIEEAKHEVLLSTYVLEGQSHAGTCLVNAILKTRATSIKFLSNHYTFFAQKTLRYLAAFACLADHLKKDKQLEIRVWKHNFYNSNHAKFVIVDGMTCSLGGYNFQESFFMEEDSVWSDLGITVTSQTLATELAGYFNTIWNQSKIVSCNRALKPNLFQCPQEPVGRILHIEQKVDDFRTLTQMPKCFFLHSRQSAAFQSIIECLAMAEHFIDIISPNVVDRCIWNLLTHKLSTIENFRVRILTNDRHNVSQSFFQLLQTERSYFCQKRKKWKHLSIRFANGTAANKKKYFETDGRTRPILIEHSKYFNVDSKHFYIGSLNMDAISLHASGEAGVIILNEPDISLQVNKFLFEACWKKATPFPCS